MEEYLLFLTGLVLVILGIGLQFRARSTWEAFWRRLGYNVKNIKLSPFQKKNVYKSAWKSYTRKRVIGFIALFFGIVLCLISVLIIFNRSRP